MGDLTISKDLTPAVGVVTSPAASASSSRPARTDGRAPVEVQSGQKLPSEEAKTAVSRSDVESAVETLNVTAALADRGLRFEIDEETDQIIVSVIDEETGEVIRRIPPEASVRLATNNLGTHGLLTNIHG